MDIGALYVYRPQERETVHIRMWLEKEKSVASQAQQRRAVEGYEEGCGEGEAASGICQRALVSSPPRSIRGGTGLSEMPQVRR